MLQLQVTGEAYLELYAVQLLGRSGKGCWKDSPAFEGLSEKEGLNRLGIFSLGKLDAEG